MKSSKSFIIMRYKIPKVILLFAPFYYTAFIWAYFNDRFYFNDIQH